MSQQVRDSGFVLTASGTQASFDGQLHRAGRVNRFESSCREYSLVR